MCNVLCVQRNTRFTGVSLKLLGKFSHQLLMTLAYLGCKERGEARIIHCDLKPENGTSASTLLRGSRHGGLARVHLLELAGATGSARARADH